MQKHKKIYFDFFNIGEQDIVLCEVCRSKAVDIHHIDPKKMGGSKQKDFIENLMALCRDCHKAAHNEVLPKADLQKVHLFHMKRYLEDPKYK